MLTQQETSEIMQKCVEIGIKGMYEGEVVTFARQQGKEVIDPMLAKLKHERDDRVAKGLRTIAAGPSLRKLMLKHTNDKAAEDKRWQVHDQRVAAHTKAYDSGYRPTVDAIRKQLDALYLDSGISLSEYEIGMRFLDGDTSQHVGDIGDNLGAFGAGEV